MDNLNEFDNYDPTEDKKEATPTSAVMSAIHGVGQGGSLGFGDEASALIDTLISKTKIPHAASFAEYLNSLGGGHPGTSPLTDSSKTRQQRRDEYRAINNKAKEDNPIAYTGGELGGAIGLPGPASVSRLARIGETGLLAATSGAGHSEADSVKGIAKDAGITGALGLGLGAAGEGVGYIAQKGSDLARKVADKILPNWRNKTPKELLTAIKDAESKNVTPIKDKDILSSEPDAFTMEQKAQQVINKPKEIDTDKDIADVLRDARTPKSIGKAVSKPASSLAEKVIAAHPALSVAAGAAGGGAGSKIAKTAIGTYIGGALGGEAGDVIDHKGTGKIIGGALGAMAGLTPSGSAKIAEKIVDKAIVPASKFAAKSVEKLYNQAIKSGLSPEVAHQLANQLYPVDLNEFNDYGK